MTLSSLRQVDLTRGFGGTDGGEQDSECLVVARPVARSFELAFDSLYRLAYRVAFKILGDRPDAEDVAQEALARASLRWSRLHEHPEGWVSRVASNLAIDRYRHRQRQPIIPKGPVGIVDEKVGERGDLVDALRTLSSRQREVVVLRYLADLSESDVAVALGCSTGTVKTHSSRGLAALRRQLQGKATTDGDDVRAS
jgi:RNA polymerase sigma-70 factor (sigma-E family)